MQVASAMKWTLRIVIWLRTDRSHEMSVQGSGPLRSETGVVEGDIMKLPYAPSRLLETSWCYTSDIYYTYAERNQESSESSNTRHHCRNGHSLKCWYTHNRYTVKIHVGNILKTITVVLICIWSHHCHLTRTTQIWTWKYHPQWPFMRSSTYLSQNILYQKPQCRHLSRMLYCRWRWL